MKGTTFFCYAILFSYCVSVKFAKILIRPHDRFTIHAPHKIHDKHLKKTNVARYLVMSPDHAPSSNAAVKLMQTDDNFKCWMTLNASKLVQTIDNIDKRYEDVVINFDNYLQKFNMDKALLEAMLSYRGAALRDFYNQFNTGRNIPAGINFGGYSMVKMMDSVLFFHRLKLRNDTRFRINFLHNDMKNMLINVQMTLNDLYLMGAYERSILIDRDPSLLLYTPSFGEVEIVLKNAVYIMEAHGRLLNRRLNVNLINSEIKVGDILMKYISNSTGTQETLNVKKANLGAFIAKLKSSLDKWSKDYFNDIMVYFQLDDVPEIKEMEEYESEKALALGEYLDNAIEAINKKIRKIKANKLNLPNFTIRSLTGLQVKLTNGNLRGLETMHRRSLVTSVPMNNARRLDAIVGFSSLKVVYTYEIMVPTGLPPVTGLITLSADELTGHLTITQLTDPEALDLQIEFVDQIKPEYLTVEGAANTMLANIKHLMESQIMSIMSNTLDYGIRLIRTVPNCRPFVQGQLGDQIPNLRSIF